MNWNTSKGNKNIMSNIYDLANELERAIRSLPEYQKAATSRSAIEADDTSRKLFQEFTTFQEGLYMKVQSGALPTEEEQAKMQELGTEIEANPVLKDYLGAQQALSVYIADIEKIVFSPLQDLVK